MSDIVTRLRGEVAWEPDVGELMALAADEIERLRADWPEQLTASSVLVAEQEREIARLRQVSSRKNLTLTSEERFVLGKVRDTYADEDDMACNEIAFVIDQLLERHDVDHVRSLEERLEELRAAANQADAEYRAEIERLESRLRFADAVIRSGDVAALTVDERKAITEASDFYVGTRTGVTLISLMKRMGCER